MSHAEASVRAAERARVSSRQAEFYRRVRTPSAHHYRTRDLRSVGIMPAPPDELNSCWTNATTQPYGMRGGTIAVVGIAQSRRTASSIWVAAETLSLVLGVGCLLYVGVHLIVGMTARRAALDRFAELRALGRTDTPELTLWSPGRVAAWQRSLTLPREEPLAVLHIPRIGLDVPVLKGTSDATLDRGAGHVEDTAMPGTPGNSGIAGHRDGFFRGLKDVSVGDAIELETLRETQTYRIERTWIVNPDDVSVLDPTSAQSITLVTCYPFYFVGSAPQRYIVRAVRDGAPRP